MNKTKNASRNILFGVILKIYQIILPFALRTIIVRELGTEYLGLNSLFTSVLQVLNLAELGVGSAMVFSMYKPIAENNKDKICALMRLYKLYYRIIGLAILIVGLIITPFVPKLISGTVPESMNIYILYIMNLSATVLSYWLFAYKNSILQAHQRTDVSSKVTIVTDTFKYASQILFIYLTHNYYYFVLFLLVSQVLNNIITAIISNKLYPDYKPNGELEKKEVKQIQKRIKDLFTSKLGGVIVNSTDTIVISSFLGLTTLAVYQNYFYILNAVMSFIAIIFNSITAGVGNSMITKSKEDNYKDFKVFTFLICGVCGFCISCFTSLFQPFMKLWMGSGRMLPFSIVVCLNIYFWIYELIMMTSVYKDAAGIWHSDRFRPLTSGIVNLILNIILVQFIGLYGIVLSTIISTLFISLPWIISNVFKFIFNQKPQKYIFNIIKYTIITLITTVCVYFVNKAIYDLGIDEFIIHLLITGMLSLVIIWLLLFKDELYPQAFNLICKMLKVKSKK